ncbi:unannotated protein [freshwater metagenome]|uniref:Unannotated protein n=1 Tax=freshwater metagenome TaxID=449393 RepID=A0A6J6VEK6_9ZZZZ
MEKSFPLVMQRHLIRIRYLQPMRQPSICLQPLAMLATRLELKNSDSTARNFVQYPQPLLDHESHNHDQLLFGKLQACVLRPPLFVEVGGTFPFRTQGAMASQALPHLQAISDKSDALQTGQHTSRFELRLDCVAIPSPIVHGDQL